MSGRRSPQPIREEQPSSAVAVAWLVVGVGAQLSYFFTADSQQLEQPSSLVLIYVVMALCLDLFVGASRRVSLQRITPVLVLALLVTPGIPATVALVTDLVATIVIAATSRLTLDIIAQAGRSLLPSAATALFLKTRGVADLDPQQLLDAHFFAAEVFLIVALLTRTSKPPFRTDIFLVVSFPAGALMLRSLAELHLAYVLLSIPLLVLMTTIDTEMLLRYFQLQRKLDDTEVAVRQTQRAKVESDLESKRRGVIIDRREKQLELLNGLGHQLDAAQQREDLVGFLLQESHRLTGAERGVVMLVEGQRIANILSRTHPSKLGLQIDDPVPALIRAGLGKRPPWQAEVWGEQRVFLIVALGNHGWLFLSHSMVDAFPGFLESFFSAVGRHSGSALLAMHRLAVVRETAEREAREKEKVALEKERVAEEKERVAAEKEKVAEQNRNLRSLIGSFDVLTEGALSSDKALIEQGCDSIKTLTGAEQVFMGLTHLEHGAQVGGDLVYDNRQWASFLHLPGEGPSGNLLCLSATRDRFTQSQLEWCSLLRNFLDKTLENGSLHRRNKASLAKLRDTQDEVVRSSQWAAAGRLAANAAHELNTPLGAIRLAAEQVQFFSKEAPEPAQKGLQLILRSVDRCREVTDRLLLTSRPVDHGANPTKPEETALRPILRDAMASVQPYLRATGINLASHRVTDDPMVDCVLQDVYWAIVNILKNSIDALNDDGGGDNKRIAVALAVQDKDAVITIADNGPGIGPGLKDRIFEPFFTTKKIGQGNGLGLSLSRTNLRKWGGNLELKESQGPGATFQITVPLA